MKLWSACTGVMGGVISMEDFQRKFFFNSVYQVRNMLASPVRLEVSPICREKHGNFLTYTHACISNPAFSSLPFNCVLSLQHNFVEAASDTSPYCKYNSQILQLVISCLYLAAAIAAIASEFMARRFGRKVSHCLSSWQHE